MIKDCPTCKRTYSDQSITFCLADGSLLSAPFDPQATQRVPASRNTDPPPTEVMNADVLPPTQPAVKVKDVPPTVASPRPSTLTFNAEQVGRQHAPAYPAQPRKKTVLIWLIPVIGISLLVALIYSMSGRESASSTSVSNKGRPESASSEALTTPSPVASAPAASPTAAPTTQPTTNRTADNQNSNVPSPPDSQGGQAQAVETVRAILRRNAGACKISKVLSVSAERTRYGWRVTARVVMAASGNAITETAVWNVSGRNGAVPADQLTADVSHGCN